MKIIIADAKTLKIQNYPITGQKPLFSQKAMFLRKQLQTLKPREIHELMHVSFKQSDLIYDYFHNDEQYPALCLYDGVVFKQLSLSHYDKSDFRYLEKHLLINSPLYGICRYNDLIQFHRLEIKHKLNGLSLYDYWQNELEQYFQNEDFILSLSTKEYEKMIHHPHLIQVDFIEISGEKIKRTAVYLKKARGQMLDQMVKNKIDQIEDIKKIVVDNYHFDENRSTPEKLVFVRNEKIKYTHL